MDLDVIIKPDLSLSSTRALLRLGTGHNTYGEQAWPNDLLYMFPISILGIFTICFGLAVLTPTEIGQPADPYATPYEILPEWFLYPTFQVLRVIPNKLVGIVLIAALPIMLMALPFLEANRYQNPLRRPFSSVIFFLSSLLTLNLAISATQPI